LTNVLVQLASNQKSAAMIDYTPRELELMVLAELGRRRSVPDGLRVQILRSAKGWRAVCRVESNDHEAADVDSISAMVSTIAEQLSSHHRLIGS